MERLTIASAKSELRCEANEKDVERVLAIYLYSLDSVGLTPETAGALQRVRSDKENEVFDKVRELLDEEIGFEGLPLSSETEERLRMECEIECTNTRLNGDDVYDEVLAEIQKGL